jgi:WS/DGAT/MGAT family acyltransferase
VAVVDQLSGLDAAFLEAESDTVHLHALGIMRLAAGESPLTPDDLHRVVAGRLHRLPQLCHRLVTVPAGLDQPYWVEAVPDLADHLHHVVLPGDGSGEFEALCAELAERHLDRTRPLWGFWLVDGLAHGGQAVVMKVHHSVSDGIGGLAIVGELLDLEPHPPEPPAPAGGEPIDGAGPGTAPTATERRPGPAWLLARAAGHVVRWPGRAVRAAVELGVAAGRLGGVVRRDPDPERATPLVAPKLASSGRISSARSIAFAELSLERVKAVGRAADARVNDVVLATLAGAVRHWLVGQGDLPDLPLVAAVPVSTRTAEDLAAPGNHVSACFVHLATHLADPQARLAATATSSVLAKEAHAAVGDQVLAHLTALVMPITVVTTLRLYSGLGLPALHPPAVNLVVSNVPGPTVPLYLAGRLVDRMSALGPIFDGSPLNVTAVSYRGVLTFACLACPERMPDLQGLADGLIPAFEELAGAYGC